MPTPRLGQPRPTILSWQLMHARKRMSFPAPSPLPRRLPILSGRVAIASVPASSWLSPIAKRASLRERRAGLPPLSGCVLPTRIERSGRDTYRVGGRFPYRARPAVLAAPHPAELLGPVVRSPVAPCPVAGGFWLAPPKRCDRQRDTTTRQSNLVPEPNRLCGPR